MSEELLKQNLADLRKHIDQLHEDASRWHAAFVDLFNRWAALDTKLRQLTDADRPQTPDVPQA
jgi:hypothetical protein